MTETMTVATHDALDALLALHDEQGTLTAAEVADQALTHDLDVVLFDVGGTLIDEAPPGSAFAVGTELNLVQRLANRHPDKTVAFLDKTVCYCSTMNRIDLPHLVWALESLARGEVVNRVTVDPDVAANARKALETMLALP